MKLLVIFAVLVASVAAQDDGVEFGGLCNGILLQCNRHNSTVICMHRDTATNACDTGVGVDLGRCSCTRNCGDGVYAEHGEFAYTKNVCGGFVGQLCTGLNPHCVDHATCNFLTSKCVCEVGYVVDTSGLRCVRA